MPDGSPNRLAIVCRACGYLSSAYIAGKIDHEGDENEGRFELSLVPGVDFLAIRSKPRRTSGKCPVARQFGDGGPHSSQVNDVQIHDLLRHRCARLGTMLP